MNLSPHGLSPRVRRVRRKATPPVQVVLCAPRNRVEADGILDALDEAGIPHAHVSVVYPKPSRDCAGAGARSPSRRGGLLGCALDWLDGIGLHAIPGQRPFLVGGPLRSALTARAVRPRRGGIAAALGDLGVPCSRAHRLEVAIRAGRILLTVHAGTDVERLATLAIFTAAGSSEVLSVPRRAPGSPSEPGVNTSITPRGTPLSNPDTPRNQKGLPMCISMICAFDSMFRSESSESLSEYKARWRRKAQHMRNGLLLNSTPEPNPEETPAEDDPKVRDRRSSTTTPNAGNHTS